MAITGNLKTFYLSSLLQLLSNDKKTGILELTDGSDIVQVYLRNGTIINAFGSSRVDRLTNYLRSEGIITEEQLQKCMAISAHTEKKIGMVLVEQDIISAELLEDLLHRQIEQTLFSLFLWEQGEFQYRDQNFDLSGQIIASFDTMQVVLEASRRVDEISEIKKRVPMDHEVLEVNPSRLEQQKNQLNTVERAVLSLINGKRTVKRVIADSGYDELKVYKTLFSLVTSGLILEENSFLKRPEDIHEEISEPAVLKTDTSAVQEKNHNASDLQTETAKDTQQDLKDSEDNAEPADVETNNTAGQSNECDTAELLVSLSDRPDKEQPDHDEPDEMILELEPEPDKNKQTNEHPASEQQDDLFTNDNLPAKTIIKIDGQILPGVDLSDIEPINATQPNPVKKNQDGETLQQISLTEDPLEDEEEYAREKQRLIKKVAVTAAAVLSLLAVILLLKMLLFSETPVEPIQPPVVKQQPVAKKKPKKAVSQKIQKPALQEEQKIVPDFAPQQQEAAFEFFQDQKGWVSINLPSGFTVSEQPYPDRTSVSIMYGDDITITLSIIPEFSDWNAEDDMYEAIVKMKNRGIEQIQKYDLLKNAGCSGYVLHFTSSRNQTSTQLALYRFSCFNKMARLEVSSVNRRTPEGLEQCRKIYTAIEESFFIYQ